MQQDGRFLPVICAAAVVVAVALVVAPARADRRILGYTYPYMTLPEGGFEFEHYLDATWKKVDDPSTQDVESQWRPAWRHQFEFEHGITDRLDFGFYNVFAQQPFGGLSYEGVKLRSRYRFGDPNDLPIDVGVYLETFYFNDEAGFEQRLILSKTVSRFEAHFNLKAEEEWELHAPEGEMEFVLNPTGGVGYHVLDSVAVGAEYFGRTAFEEEKWTRFAHYAGPAVSVMGRHFWWTLTFQPQITSGTGRPDYQARSLFAIML